MEQLLVTAHAGSENTPANSIESIIKAFEIGAHICEIDVISTKDGVPVLHHNHAIKSVDDELFYINQINFSTIQLLLGANKVDYEVPRFDVLENYVKLLRINLNIDLKDEESIEPVVKLIKEWGIEDQVIFSGCTTERALIIKSCDPNLKSLYSVDDGLFEDNSLSDKEKYLQIEKAVIHAGCHGINMRHVYASKEFVDYFKKKNIPVYIWTVEPGDNFWKYIEMGVFSITTNHPKYLLEQLY